MTFNKSISTCLNKNLNFKGRASRSEFWHYFLFFILINIILSSLVFMYPSSTLHDEMGTLTFLGYILLLIIFFPPYISVVVRRLHDTGRSGTWLLIGLIPLVGFLIIVPLCKDSDEGDNIYGPNPKNTNHKADNSKDSSAQKISPTSEWHNSNFESTSEPSEKKNINYPSASEWHKPNFESTSEPSEKKNRNYPSVEKEENSSKSTVENSLNFDYLEKLKLLGELRRDNVLTEEEFEKEKKKILDTKEGNI